MFSSLAVVLGRLRSAKRYLLISDRQQGSYRVSWCDSSIYKQHMYLYLYLPYIVMLIYLSIHIYRVNPRRYSLISDRQPGSSRASWCISLYLYIVIVVYPCLYIYTQISMYLYLHLYLSIYPYLYRSIYLSIYLYV